MAILIEDKYLFQKKFKSLLKRKKVSSNQLADMLKISQSSACRFSNLTSHGRLPTIFQLKIISEQTLIPIEQFFKF